MVEWRAGHVARMGEKRNAYRILVWKARRKERDHLEDQDVDGLTILKWILEIEWDGMDWVDVTQNRYQVVNMPTYV
jgi:hypothetical protein